MHLFMLVGLALKKKVQLLKCQGCLSIAAVAVCLCWCQLQQLLQ